jgi:hypothetical protein
MTALLLQVFGEQAIELMIFGQNQGGRHEAMPITANDEKTCHKVGHAHLLGG